MFRPRYNIHACGNDEPLKSGTAAVVGCRSRGSGGRGEASEDAGQAAPERMKSKATMTNCDILQKLESSDEPTYISSSTEAPT